MADNPVCPWIEREGDECSLGPYRKGLWPASLCYHHHHSPLPPWGKADVRPVLQMGKWTLVLVSLKAAQLMERLQSI